MKTPLRSRPSSGAPWAENGPGVERRSGFASRPRCRNPLARPWKRRSPIRSNRPEGRSPGPTPEGHRSFGNRRPRERERLRFRQRRPTAEACPLAARGRQRPSRGRPARVVCPAEGGAAPAIRNDRDRGPGRVGPPARNPASGSRPPPNSGAPGPGGFKRPPRRPTESTPVTGASDAFTCMPMMERADKRSNRNRETNRTILCITRLVLHNRCTDYPQVYAHLSN